MSKLTSTLIVDGEPVEEGSVRAVELLAKLFTELDQRMVEESSQLLGRCPDEVQEFWRGKRDRVQRVLSTLAQHTRRFADDYAEHGLEWALDEARFRKELP